jgi:KipI family sensor histidine kinase inhibitor
MKVLPFGDAALLVELDDLDGVLALAAAVRGQRFDGVLDVVPAARTVLLVTEPGTPLDPLAARVTSLSPTPSADTAEAEAVEIAVVYDGPDLAEVARLTGLSERDVVEAHTGTPWRIAFGGFAPGFAYLTGGDPRLSVPRRDEPRTTVPAGAVGLAGEYSGVYPRPSPGGWQLIGRTDAVLWDAERDPPALLAPGGSVRFRVAS